MYRKKDNKSTNSLKMYMKMNESRNNFRLNKCFADRQNQEQIQKNEKERWEVYLFILNLSPQQRKHSALLTVCVFLCSRLMGKHNVDEMSDCKMCLYDKCGPA